MTFTSSFSVKSKCEETSEGMKEKKLFNLICEGLPYYKAKLSDIYTFNNSIENIESPMISPGEQVIVKRLILSNENLKAKNGTNATSSFSTSLGCYFLCTYVRRSSTTFYTLFYLFCLS